jgi:hypothetical protein
LLPKEGNQKKTLLDPAMQMPRAVLTSSLPPGLVRVIWICFEGYLSIAIKRKTEDNRTMWFVQLKYDACLEKS